MKILMVYTHYEVCSGRYLTDAFKRLGHEVIHIGGEAHLKDAWGVSVPEKYIWQPDSPQMPKGWTPDLIIIADSTPQGYQPSFAGIPMIVIGVDNHVRNYHFIKANHYFLSHAHGPAQPVTRDDETWLSCAYDPQAFKPSTIPWDEREYDVCCVGVMYPRRVELIERLRAEGFKVFAATGLVYDEYQAAYANSRISLCVSAAGDVAQRIFETAAIGCAVLTDHLLDLDDEQTQRQLGLHGYFCYENPDVCVMQVRALLGDERALAQAGAHIIQQNVMANHTWDKRAQVVVDWFNKEYDNLATVTIPKEAVVALPETRLPKAYLNLGCGKTHLPSAKPAGHEGVDDAIYKYPLWVNVDKVQGVGADKTFDLFTYPWPLEDNSFDGALCAHILEHIPHEIKVLNLVQRIWDRVSITDPNYDEYVEIVGQETIDRAKELSNLQDGWYAFFSELYRVLTPGAMVHIVSPYGWSDGGITDPSHTRYLTINAFMHSMTPETSDGSTFQYNNGGINFVIDGAPMYRITPTYAHVRDQEELQNLMMTRLNVVYDFYLKLKVVK